MVQRVFSSSILTFSLGSNVFVSYAWITSLVSVCSLQAASALLILRANGSKIVLPWFCFLIARPSSSPLFSCTQEQEPSSSPLFSCTQSVSHPKTDVNSSRSYSRWNRLSSVFSKVHQVSF
ncbi:hypothetical protein GmHk_19G055082 [Glycine max]|nr:hypothetical protein GmHk_19G055082 [Glycine max]